MQCCGIATPKSRRGRTYVEEPTLAEALADPLVRAVMAADRVDPDKLESMLVSVARTFGSDMRGA
jgi:hypothetical protein